MISYINYYLNNLKIYRNTYVINYKKYYWT